MATVPFKYYLHDDYSSSEFFWYITEHLGIKLADNVTEEDVQSPFYEVQIDCTIDTETGKITPVEAKL